MNGFPICSSIFAGIALILLVYKTIHFFIKIRHRHFFFFIHFSERSVVGASSTASRNAKRLQNAMSKWLAILLGAAFFSFLVLP